MEGQKDRKTLFYRTFPATAGHLIEQFSANLKHITKLKYRRTFLELLSDNGNKKIKWKSQISNNCVELIS